jgi:hypothetical protein
MTKTVIVQSQQKWEYCFQVRKTETALLITLNELGQLGWELVDSVHHKDPKGDMCWTAFLKRPSVGQAAAPDHQAASPVVAAPIEDKSVPPPVPEPGGGEYELKSQ